MYMPAISGSILEAGPSVGATLTQGQRVENGDLDFLLVYPSTGQRYSPYAITYSVGFVSMDDGSYHPMGRTDRTPLELRTGRFRPYFQIGDKWFTGSYLIVWSYQVSGGDPLTVTPVPFTVLSRGIYNNVASGLGVFDLPATLTAFAGAPDFPGSLDLPATVVAQ
jgi:hypothetical protein